MNTGENEGSLHEGGCDCTRCNPPRCEECRADMCGAELPDGDGAENCMCDLPAAQDHGDFVVCSDECTVAFLARAALRYSCGDAPEQDPNDGPEHRTPELVRAWERSAVEWYAQGAAS